MDGILTLLILAVIRLALPILLLFGLGSVLKETSKVS
jgi:hypothetical protein